MCLSFGRDGGPLPSATTVLVEERSGTRATDYKGWRITPMSFFSTAQGLVA